MDYIILPIYVGYDNDRYLPDVRSMYLQKSIYELHALGFKTEVISIPYSEDNMPGTIVKMSPRAFTKVKLGRTISLTVAGHKEDIILPSYLNLSLRNGMINLEKQGLSLDTVIYEYSNDIKEGHITFQFPKEGHVVKSGALVTFGISKGNTPDYYIVPDLIGISLYKAKEILAKSGLRLGRINYENQPELISNTVIEQSYTAGMRVSFPAAVDIIISKDE